VQINENSQIVEQNRRIIALLEDIKKQGMPLTIDDLSPADKQAALSVKLASTSIGECIAVEAAKRGLSVEEFSRQLGKHAFKPRSRSFAEIAGVQN
jgi:hypothetical protein